MSQYMSGCYCGKRLFCRDHERLPHLIWFRVIVTGRVDRMTNKYSAYPHRIPGGFGFWAMIRLCRDSHPSPVMDKGERPKVFLTKGEAAEECLKHMVAFMNGREIRGETFDASPTIKEVKFATAERKLFRGCKIITVETRA